jgi:hypothetical protein
MNGEPLLMAAGELSWCRQQLVLMGINAYVKK